MQIEAIETSVYEVPLPEQESDGTLSWSKVTVVSVEPKAAGRSGLGWTYATGACARLIDDVLTPAILGSDALDVTGAWETMVRAIRNFGRPGIASMAIAAVDLALWDLKGRLLDQPVVKLLGQVRSSAPAYGSGGFCSESDEELARQLLGWVEEDGMGRVKMKVGAGWGSHPDRDLARAAMAREVIGDAELFVDANGAYNLKQAVRMAEAYRELGATWFEEPVSSDHLDALAEIRALTTIDVAAGEYGYDLFYFSRMCRAGAVDCLQADISRCGGLTEWMRAAAVAASFGLQISAHCGPTLHTHPACAVTNLAHVEYFVDHVRVDGLLFDGAVQARDGHLTPDLSRPGLGVDLKRQDAARFRVAS